MPEVKVELIILYEDRTWKEYQCGMTVPEGTTEQESQTLALRATNSNLAATGELKKVFSIATHKITMKEEDATAH